MVKRASVAIVLRENEILLIKRAHNPRDRWSGHIGFPGGKSKPDEDRKTTAERETLEEIGIDLSSNNVTLLFSLEKF